MNDKKDILDEDMLEPVASDPSRSVTESNFLVDDGEKATISIRYFLEKNHSEPAFEQAFLTKRSVLDQYSFMKSADLQNPNFTSSQRELLCPVSSKLALSDISIQSVMPNIVKLQVKKVDFSGTECFFLTVQDVSNFYETNRLQKILKNLRIASSSLFHELRTPL